MKVRLSVLHNPRFPPTYLAISSWCCLSEWLFQECAMQRPYMIWASYLLSLMGLFQYWLSSSCTRLHSSPRIYLWMCLGYKPRGQGRNSLPPTQCLACSRCSINIFESKEWLPCERLEKCWRQQRTTKPLIFLKPYLNQMHTSHTHATHNRLLKILR